MADEEYRQPRFTPPEGATEIILVRHGESAPARPDRPFPLVDGHGDPPLAPDGHQQAAAVGRRLQGEPIDAVYVSSLRRTHQTAAPLVEATGLEPVVEPDLREVHLGEWEGGVFRKHVVDGHPIARQMFETRRWDAIPGAESNEAFSGRVTAALARLHDAHRDQRLAVFAHGGVIGAAVAHTVGGDPFGFAAVDNGSVTHVVVLDEWWHLRTYNDTSHLGPLLARAGLTAPITGRREPPTRSGTDTVGAMQQIRRVLAALGIAALVAAVLRLRGSGGTPPSDGGWRELSGPELR